MLDALENVISNIFSWSTHWFRLKIDVPESWIDEEVHLVWDSGTEAMVWKNGEPLQVVINQFELSRTATFCHHISS